MALFLMVMRRLVKRRDWRQQAESGVTSQVPEAQLASQRRALRSKTPIQTAGYKMPAVCAATETSFLLARPTNLWLRLTPCKAKRRFFYFQAFQQFRVLVFQKQLFGKILRTHNTGYHCFSIYYKLLHSRQYNLILLLHLFCDILKSYSKLLQMLYVFFHCFMVLP